MPSRRLTLLLVVLAALVALWTVGGCATRRAAGWAVDRYLAHRFDGVATVTTAEAAAALDTPAPPLVLDTRQPDEYATSHLPGARHLAPDADPATALADVPRDRPVLVYCSVGWRSASVAQRMAAAGFTDVRNIEGSIFRWAIEGRPLVDAAGAPTERVHAFGPPWSWLVPADRRAE